MSGSEGGDQSRRPAATVVPNISQMSVSMEKADAKEKIAAKNPGLLEAQNNFANLLDILKENEDIPKNILMVGEPKVGKSSLIDLLLSAVRGRYETVADPGGARTGDIGSLTGHLRFFRNCGLSDRQFREFRERNQLPDDCYLPTIIDMPGLELEADIIKYILSGATLPNAELKSFMTGNALSPYLSIEDCKSRRIDRVIFVASIKKDAPLKMVKDVFKFVRGDDGKLPVIPHFLAITHIDEADDPRSDEEKNVVNAWVDALILRGQVDLRMQEVANYGTKDKSDSKRVQAFVTDHKKHANGLALLCKVLTRREVIIPPGLSDAPVTKLTPYFEYAVRAGKKIVHLLCVKARQISNSEMVLQINWQYVGFFFLLIVVAVISMMLQKMLMTMK